MGEINVKDMADLKEFLKWRRENPEDYKLFLEDLQSFYKDIFGVLQRGMQ